MALSNPLRTASLALAAGMVLASCGGTSGDTSPTTTTVPAPVLRVATSFFPVTDIATRIIGELPVDIVQLTPPGTDAHGHELTARQIDDLSSVDVVLHLGGGLQPSIEKAVEQLPPSVKVVDLSASIEMLPIKKSDDDHDHGHEDDHGHGEMDPHVWLDPAHMATMTRNAARALAEALPDSAAVMDTNAGAFIDELENLGTEIDAAFGTCASRSLVTSHDAFAYLAERANLDTVPIAGINPENEPSAKELESIAAAARGAGATTVFLEEQLPDNLTRTVADAIDAEVATISAVETMTNAELASGQDYISRMRENIATIATGLGCR